MMAEAEEMQITAASAETQTWTQLSEPQIRNTSPSKLHWENTPQHVDMIRKSWVNKSL